MHLLLYCKHQHAPSNNGLIGKHVVATTFLRSKQMYNLTLIYYYLDNFFLRKLFDKKCLIRVEGSWHYWLLLVLSYL